MALPSSFVHGQVINCLEIQQIGSSARDYNEAFLSPPMPYGPMVLLSRVGHVFEVRVDSSQAHFYCQGSSLARIVNGSLTRDSIFGTPRLLGRACLPPFPSPFTDGWFELVVGRVFQQSPSRWIDYHLRPLGGKVSKAVRYVSTAFSWKTLIKIASCLRTRTPLSSILSYSDVTIPRGHGTKRDDHHHDELV